MDAFLDQINNVVRNNEGVTVGNIFGDYDEWLYATPRHKKTGSRLSPGLGRRARGARRGSSYRSADGASGRVARIDTTPGGPPMTRPLTSGAATVRSTTRAPSPTISVRGGMDYDC